MNNEEEEILITTEKQFFKSNVEGEWTSVLELICSNDLICSETLIIIS